MITPLNGTNIRLLPTMRPLMRLMLRLRRTPMRAPRIRTHILSLPCMLRLMVLQLLFGAERLAAWPNLSGLGRDLVRTDVFVEVRVCAADVSE